MRILAFDPGESTGFCEALTSPSDDSFQVVKSCTIAWRLRFAEIRLLLQGIKEAPLPDAIVVESFRLYAHRAQSQIGSDFPSARVLGVIEAYAYELGVVDRIIFQPASVMSRVQILSEHASSIERTEHARDAYKHLRYYIVTNKQVPF